MPDGHELARRATEARSAGEHPEPVLVTGHQVRATQPFELHPVFEHAQHTVVARELGRLLATHVAELSECGEGRQRSALVDAVVGRAVHELQQLHRELDVADAAGPELDLHVDLIGRDVLRDSLAHALHGLDEALATRTRPDLRRDTGDVPAAELEISGEGPRLQQRLELPALRPPVVVLQMRLERAHEGAVLPLGAEVRIDLPERRLDAGLADDAHRQHGEPGCDVERPRRGDHVFIDGLGDEDDVDVAHVVELAGPGLAHADDREPRGLDLSDRIAPGRGRLPRCAADDTTSGRERRIERCAGEIGETRGDDVDHVDRIGAGEVVDRDIREQPAIPDADRPCRRLREVGGRGRDLVERGEQRRTCLGHARRRAWHLCEHREIRRMPQQVVGESARCPDESNQARRGVLMLENTGELGRRLLVEPRDDRERLVGVGRLREDLEERVERDAGAGRQRFERRRGAAQIAEARTSDSSERGGLTRHPVRQRISRLRCSSNGVTSER